MDVGVVRIAEDKDFEKLKQLYDDNNEWRLDYNKPDLSVWTKTVTGTSFRMVKIKTRFPDVLPETLYDVLHDPEYRKVWDTHMIESKDIGFFNPNNDIGYYSMACPSPLKNRDFVLHRSWLDIGHEQLIINHSVFHKDHPPRKNYVRATSYLTGYIVRQSLNGDGCELGYVSHTDPHGKLPVWLVNKVTQIFAPKMVKKLHKAALGYPSWKNLHKVDHKPWHFPEQISAPRIRIEDCVKSIEERNSKNNFVDESELKEAPSKETTTLDSD
ncbi:START domain-containing protein 10 [Neodiprion pinetum]|uniref:START domain-containing protein 10 n=1 Tax=Neodiprion pinetum TaxID=441929 RepID=UPI001EDE6F85|nr:START domain-containing protein 10-like [Neodiprion pinetum]XP_046471469.1 START domain-containing protein 10-like [Neodiprion pinetum]XP_046471470.1 START domain-containing protein 10-like [Neodiprion pinetum]XP_046471471.1 START domain-containing protein 10-like [Neodiprion pinetum]